MLDHFNKAGLDKLVDKLLGNRRFNAKYSYSDIFKTLLATYTTNGSCIEDSRRNFASFCSKFVLLKNR